MFSGLDTIMFSYVLPVESLRIVAGRLAIFLAVKRSGNILLGYVRFGSIISHFGRKYVLDSFVPADVVALAILVQVIWDKLSGGVKPNRSGFGSMWESCQKISRLSVEWDVWDLDEQYEPAGVWRYRIFRVSTTSFLSSSSTSQEHSIVSGCAIGARCKDLYR